MRPSREVIMYEEPDDRPPVAGMVGSDSGVIRLVVCHIPGQREWAPDDYGDGIHELHCNTMEGNWSSLGNFLCLFRCVNKDYLSQYTAIFEMGHNLTQVTPALLRAMMTPCTSGTT